MTNDWNNADSLSQICLPVAVIEFASLYFILFIYLKFTMIKTDTIVCTMKNSYAA